MRYRFLPKKRAHLTGGRPPPPSPPDPPGPWASGPGGREGVLPGAVNLTFLAPQAGGLGSGGEEGGDLTCLPPPGRRPGAQGVREGGRAEPPRRGGLFFADTGGVVGWVHCPRCVGASR